MKFAKTLAVVFCCSMLLSSFAAAQKDEQKKMPGAKAGKGGKGGMSMGKEGHRAFRAGDSVFIKMPKLVEQALRPALDAQGVPDETALINGISVGRVENQIKTANNVVTAVAAECGVHEDMLKKPEAALLRKLGAKADPGGVQARGYLRLPADVIGEAKAVTIEVKWPKAQKFTFEISELKKKFNNKKDFGKKMKEHLKEGRAGSTDSAAPAGGGTTSGRMRHDMKPEVVEERGVHEDPEYAGGEDQGVREEPEGE